MNTSIIQKIRSAPTTPGVYLFYQNQSPLYIGKATNLHSRLRSYLKADNLKIDILHQEANRLQLTKLSSPIEALIRESQLIKTLKPKYNVLWRDDKNYFYVAFTKEKFPKVYITHQPLAESRKLKADSWNTIGPFTDGASLKIALKILRRYFPYCICRQTHHRQCLNAQIKNCLGVCCSAQTISLSSINDRQCLINYKNNISNLKNILLGKNRKFVKKLKNPSELMAVENIYNHSNFLNSKFAPPYGGNSKLKLECYDISNFAGKEAVGAMTSFNQVTGFGDRELKWTTNKNDWRKFKIKTSATRNDPAMIAEILQRRLNHPEWPYPDLIIIDGGITQYNAAKKVLNKFLNHKSKILNLKLISFAKPNQKIIGLENLSFQNQKFIGQLSKEKIIEKIIQQTHNFVIGYHKQLRKKEFIRT